jgi:hypothetical protein
VRGGREGRGGVREIKLDGALADDIVAYILARFHTEKKGGEGGRGGGEGG